MAGLGPTGPTSTVRNTEWAKVRWSLLAAGVTTVVGLLGSALVDGMSGGYAIAFVAVFLTVSSLAVAGLFVHRARVMDDVLSDPVPLARWVHSDAVARKHVEQEYREFRERNRAVFWLVGGMLVVAALALFLFVDEGGPATGLILLGVAAVLFVVSRVTPGLERRRALRAPRESIITRRGVVHEGQVFPFRSFLVGHDGVTLRPTDGGEPPTLVFAFTQLTGGRVVQEFEVSVPVPAGEEERARRVEAYFADVLG